MVHWSAAELLSGTPGVSAALLSRGTRLCSCALPPTYDHYTLTSLVCSGLVADSPPGTRLVLGVESHRALGLDEEGGRGLSRGEGVKCWIKGARADLLAEASSHSPSLPF